MGFETIKLDKGEHLATITLNRPEKRNAINRKMMEELSESLKDVSEDDGIRAVVLTGAGKAFCAGADFDIMPGGGDVEKLGGQSVETLRNSFIFRSAKKIRNWQKPRFMRCRIWKTKWIPGLRLILWWISLMNSIMALKILF